MKISYVFASLALLLTLLNSSALFANTSNDPTPAPLPNNNLSFCRQQKWAKICLNTLLTYRCEQYFFLTSPLEVPLCSAAALSMINLLDYKTVQVVENNKIYRFKIIFTNELRSLIKNPMVEKYLSSLAIELKEALLQHKHFDLFKHTLKYAGDRNTAVKWIAILFQDTSFSRVQVAYLEEFASKGQLNSKELKVKDLMKEVAILLEPKLLVKENFHTWLKIYPEIKGNDLNSYLNSSFYHFYPMAHIASHLKQNFWIKKYAFLIPFILNSDYEFQTLDPERWPYLHPLPFEITPNLDWKMRDIYAGLVGSLYGAKREDLIPSFGPFKTQFASNPFKTMRAWAHKR